MVTSWEDFGCSEGMEADLDDNSTFLGWFRLVFWEGFGSSRGMKPDLDDSFTFRSCFVGLQGLAVVPAISGPRFFDPRWTYSIVHKLLKIRSTF